MSKKVRDFYHFQDKLSLAWTHSSGRNLANDKQLAELSLQINLLFTKTDLTLSEVESLKQLTSEKIEILETALALSDGKTDATEHAEKEQKKEVDVSLSSSGMGFFSERPAEEDTNITISLLLETMDLEVDMTATVLECRVSADSQNPGCWIRVRFDRDQDREIDQILAHVTHRQIEKLQRKSDSDQDNAGSDVINRP